MVSTFIFAATTAFFATTYIMKRFELAKTNKALTEIQDAYEDVMMINSALQAHSDELSNQLDTLNSEMIRRAEQRKADKKKAAAKMKPTKVEAVVIEPSTTKKRKYTKKSN